METTEAPQQLYIPKYAKSMATAGPSQIRLGLQGWAGTGKTWAALTFPGPVVVSLDRGLAAHVGRKDVIEAPFYNIDFCKKVNPNHKDKHNMADTLRFFLDKEAKKLEPDQTLIWDGCSGTQYAYHQWYENNKVVSTRSGKEDEYAEWRLKIDYFTNIHEHFKTLQCHVIFIAHENPQKEKDGGYLGKVRPLLGGQFGDQILKEYTNWFRQLTKDKPKEATVITPQELFKWGFKTVDEYKEMTNQFKGNTIYYWQTEGDDIFDAKCSLVDAPRFIPASFETFKRYQRISQV